jgi:hypothetical protein
MSPRFLTALVIGTMLQLAMVIVGHGNAAVAELFGPIGVTISFLAGLFLTIRAPRQGIGPSLAGGALVGGLCALIGIALSWGLGDVAAPILAFGTLSSAVTGAIGGFLGRFGARREI